MFSSAQEDIGSRHAINFLRECEETVSVEYKNLFQALDILAARISALEHGDEKSPMERKANALRAYAPKKDLK